MHMFIVRQLVNMLLQRLGYPVAGLRVPARHCSRVSTPAPARIWHPSFHAPGHLCTPVRCTPQRTDDHDTNEWRWEETDDALRAYSALFFCLAGGALLPLSGLRYADLGYFTGLAICTIYIGAHRGLSSKMRTTITFKQGLLAPIACSVALFGGYLLIKMFPDLSLSTILNTYFFVLGSVAVSGSLTPLARQLVRVVSVGVVSLKDHHMWSCGNPRIPSMHPTGWVGAWHSIPCRGGPRGVAPR